jgi:hypothetical protein
VWYIWQTTPKLLELKAKMVEYAKQHSIEVGEGLKILLMIIPLLDVFSWTSLWILLPTMQYVFWKMFLIACPC